MNVLLVIVIAKPVQGPQKMSVLNVFKVVIITLTPKMERVANYFAQLDITKKTPIILVNNVM